MRNSRTVDHALSPASVISGVASSADCASSNRSMSSEFTPFDCRKAAFFSRGALRMAGSSRKRDACSANDASWDGCSGVSSFADASAAGAGSDCGWDSGCGSGSDGVLGVVEGDAGWARCHEGMLGLPDITVCAQRRLEET